MAEVAGGVVDAILAVVNVSLQENDQVLKIDFSVMVKVPG